ncbi:hypothetical protein C8R44DRAFT_875747 [Mycena epipterygia]|nr:hypothetical protein C8R44DRAFT_875747 [Mycena epipterygia]
MVYAPSIADPEITKKCYRTALHTADRYNEMGSTWTMDEPLGLSEEQRCAIIFKPMDDAETLGIKNDIFTAPWLLLRTGIKGLSSTVRALANSTRSPDLTHASSSFTVAGTADSRAGRRELACTQEASRQRSSDTSILEDVKPKRRHGVSNLRIPRASLLFTAVQGRMTVQSSVCDARDSSSDTETPRPVAAPSSTRASASSAERASMRSASPSGARPPRASQPCSPRPHSAQVPADVLDADAEEGEWEECDEEVPLSPLLRDSRPRPSRMCPPALLVRLILPLLRRLAPLAFIAVGLGLPLLLLRVRVPDRDSAHNPTLPALRSRWSSFTLSYLHSPHARSPSKAFFGRRYFPAPRVPSFAGRGFSAPSLPQTLPSSFASPHAEKERQKREASDGGGRVLRATFRLPLYPLPRPSPPPPPPLPSTPRPRPRLRHRGHSVDVERVVVRAFVYVELTFLGAFAFYPLERLLPPLICVCVPPFIERVLPLTERILPFIGRRLGFRLVVVGLRLGRGALGLQRRERGKRRAEAEADPGGDVLAVAFVRSRFVLRFRPFTHIFRPRGLYPYQSKNHLYPPRP